jgi:hypothetical protein
MLALIQDEMVSHTVTLVLLSAGFVGSYLLVSSVLQYWRLRHISGPFLAAWTDFWLMRQLNGTKNFYDVRKRLHQRYGPVQRYGPNRVMFSDVSAIHSVLPASNILSKVCKTV